MVGICLLILRSVRLLARFSLQVLAYMLIKENFIYLMTDKAIKNTVL